MHDTHRPHPSLTLSRIVPGMDPFPVRLAAETDANALMLSRPNGEVLFDEGSPCTGMLVLESGIVRVTRFAPSGRELMLYRVLPGETCVLTLSCLLGHATYPARGVAEGDVSGVYLPTPLFEQLIAESVRFRQFVFAAFASRLRGVLELASAVSFERLDRRLAAALLERVERTGLIELEVTHQQLADDLGCTREPISRLLEGLAAQGIVDLGRGRIHIRNKAALSK